MRASVWNLGQVLEQFSSQVVRPSTVTGKHSDGHISFALGRCDQILSADDIYDNEGAKFSLVKGYSDAPAIAAICALTATALDKPLILPWYSRVRSIEYSGFPSRNVSHRILWKEIQSPKADVLTSFQESLKFLAEFG